MRPQQVLGAQVHENANIFLPVGVNRLQLLIHQAIANGDRKRMIFIYRAGRIQRSAHAIGHVIADRNCNLFSLCTGVVFADKRVRLLLLAVPGQRNPLFLHG